MCLAGGPRSAQVAAACAGNKLLTPLVGAHFLGTVAGMRCALGHLDRPMNPHRHSKPLRSIATQQAAADAAKVAARVLDEMLDRVAAGEPPSAETFLEAEARFLEARAQQRRTRAGVRPARS
jgi:hypothetical protein